MTTLTIPKQLTKSGDLVIIPRKEYEALLRATEKKEIKDWLNEEPYATELQKRIESAKRELKENKIIQWKLPN